jgi:hypothetical protein
VDPVKEKNKEQGTEGDTEPYGLLFQEVKNSLHRGRKSALS